MSGFVTIKSVIDCGRFSNVGGYDAWAVVDGYGVSDVMPFKGRLYHCHPPIVPPHDVQERLGIEDGVRVCGVRWSETKPEGWGAGNE